MDEFGVLSLRALTAPLLIDSYALQERVMQSSLAARMLDELRKLNLAGIGILPGAMQRPLGFGHRLAAPDDFRGLTVGSQPSRVTDAVLRTLAPARPRSPPVCGTQTGSTASWAARTRSTTRLSMSPGRNS